ncbi:hypothetical protein [uncultured Methanobrevibacter sp.]|uniref:hypothetical protein n=1 Tax=uncultured Methanobrevibacter sp. TaxID=253161 RepID=UPI00260A1431|nr:hypothetical protein [uncultured Methanobrevibacter sp.]
MKLSLEILREEAKAFCENESSKTHPKLLGVTDGKAVGTYVEHKFQEYLSEKYEFTVGSSAIGIDLPDSFINTDIKVTSIKQPQSSCPFKNTNQKVFGLGYNLLVFVYEKEDIENECFLKFKHCTFIESSKTGDYTLTKRLREMVKDGAIKEDILGFLEDKNVPGDEIILNQIADEVLLNMPEQGYLTISNALQWRLQYKRAINLKNEVSGVYNYDW